MSIPATHYLKTYPEFYNAVASGAKTFDIRRNDRDFKVGDVLALKEYDGGSDEYTGRMLLATISYITDFQQYEDNVVLGFHHSTVRVLGHPGEDY